MIKNSIKLKLHDKNSPQLFLFMMLLLSISSPSHGCYVHTLTAPSFVGLIGVDYQPNHYSQITNGLHNFNDHDVFYVDNNSAGAGITNIHAELSQLKAAGFTTVRSYQTIDYAWVGLINAANSLGMYVIYEAVIPQGGTQADINTATALLQKIISNIGTTIFNKTVILVLAGHENYSNTNISYLTTAVAALQGVTTVPVSSALISPDLTNPPSIPDMTALVNSYSPTAPLGFDPYPFQWETPIADSVTNVGQQQSIAWDYAQVASQSFYTSGRAILMTESGWASAAGTYQVPGYYCNTPVSPFIGCNPSVTNEATYLSALYTYVQVPGNNAGLLVFEAYDEPAKLIQINPTPPPYNFVSPSMENYYGVFDQDCNLKGPNNTQLLPNTGFSPSSQHGCQGFSMGAFFALNAQFDPGATVAIQQTNPVTGLPANITVTNIRLGPFQQTAPWPYFLVYKGAKVTIRGGDNHHPNCTSTVTAIQQDTSIYNQTITFSGTCNCNTVNTCFA